MAATTEAQAVFPRNVKSEIAHASLPRHSNPMEKPIFIEDLTAAEFQSYVPYS
jgi:hypothetical protein